MKFEMRRQGPPHRTAGLSISRNKMASTVTIPGQLLGPTSKYKPGPGTHIHQSSLYSSLLGVVHITQPAKAPGPVKRLNKITLPPPPAELPTISVSRSGISEKREILPEVGNVVLCRVVRISPRQAVVAILICGDTVLDAEWQGVIRAQDVRATEKDKVKIYESFRPGDIVRAEVVSGSLLALVLVARR
jgi:exosome complex component CSL4